MHRTGLRNDLDVVQLRFCLHFLFAVLCYAHFLHGRDAVAREFLIDDIGLGELQWVRHGHGRRRCRTHRHQRASADPVPAPRRYVRFTRGARPPDPGLATARLPAPVPRARVCAPCRLFNRWLSFFFEQTSSRGEAAASGPGPLGPHFTGTPAGANASRCPPPGGQRCPPHAHATASPRSLAGSVQARSRCCATSACCRCAAERARHAHGGYAGGRGAQDERGRRGRARHEHESGPPGTESATTAYRGRARNGAMVPDNHHT